MSRGRNFIPYKPAVDLLTRHSEDLGTLLGDLRDLGYTNDVADDTAAVIERVANLQALLAAFEQDTEAVRVVWHALDYWQTTEGSDERFKERLAEYRTNRVPLSPMAADAVLARLAKAAQFPIAVPTCTGIIHDVANPHRVAVIEHAEKHKGKLTCFGGKLTGGGSPLDCLFDEFGQEVGGKGAKLIAPKLWAIKTCRFADPRVVTLKKATDGFCAKELENVPVLAFYGVPDHVYVGTSEGTLYPKDGEAKSVKWVDVRDICITERAEDSLFGAMHDLLLARYRYSLDGEPVEMDTFTDAAALRAWLIERQSR